MLKKLFSHTIIYGLAPQVTKVAGVLALPIITQHLGEEDFGIYGIVTAIAGLITVLSTLGLRVILVNTYYKNPGQYKWAWRQIYGFLTLWNLPYALLLTIILYFFIPVEARDNHWLIIVLNVLPVVLFGPTLALGSAYYQLKQQPFQIGIRAVVFGLLTVLLNIYFIAFLRLGYMGWFISNCIVAILNNASYWLPLNRKFGFTPIFNFKWRLINRYLSISLPIVPHYYSTYLLDTSDRAIMKMVNVPTEHVGLYNVAYTVGNLVNSLGMASNLAVGPLVNEAYKKSKHSDARYLIFIMQAAFFCITFCLAIWLKEIFVLLIRNEALQGVYPLGVIIVMAYNYRPMYAGASSRLFYLEKTKVLLKVTFTAGFINVLLNFIFIPIYGYRVAVFTTFFALMYMGYAGYFLKEFRDNTDVNYYPLRWIGCTVFLTFMAYFTVELNIVVKTTITVIVLSIALMFLRKLSHARNA